MHCPLLLSVLPEDGPPQTEMLQMMRSSETVNSLGPIAEIRHGVYISLGELIGVGGGVKTRQCPLYNGV